MGDRMACHAPGVVSTCIVVVGVAMLSGIAFGVVGLWELGDMEIGKAIGMETEDIVISEEAWWTGDEAVCACCFSIFLHFALLFWNQT